MSDYSAKFDALRAISTKLTKKEDVSAEEWAAAGMPAGTPIKKVNAEITKLKKMVSATTKAATEAEMEDDDGAGGKRGGHRQDTRAKKDVRRLGADTKSASMALARGEGLLSTNRVDTTGGVYGDE
uniref:Uncharacterized protein n=1 Tax=Neobodo designis TaxID=312471 RepID=A0A7S1R005_NEODS|mmetsp:Transcript_5909/g.18640  ORF Transcript_5909/g.18640 Transcript_5909/m.18640 type:complete len:126 (+) Transcript_5909:39-416(+)|eukprot:CAMPEP_0174853962 /NCGR_PEP_ID=MMETSP1114-20130205/29661_1 /TAXON_ID=312471 /ORGANISM="Neobodo designis, Strain CCAP 1951/1" /LENGTH=125 /DNA_ID=CAMNT_0016088629 /DNA_START=39 /DNA_END=416 /DNA_ORIENTATION=+